MYARLSFIEGPPDTMEAGTASFRGAVAPTVRQDSGKGAILLIDRENGKAIGMTLWPDEATIRGVRRRRTGCGYKPRMRYTRPRRRELSATRLRSSNRSENW